MKKHVLLVKIISAILLSLCLILTLYFFKFENLSEFEKTLYIGLDSELCQILFDCTPTEFFYKEFEFYNETGDFRNKAYLTDEGMLVLVLSPSQRQVWKNSEWLTSFKEIQNMTEIELSSDLKTLTAYVYTRTRKEDIQKNKKILDFIVAKVHIIHTLEGVPPEENFITFVEKDKTTGDILDCFDIYNVKQ